MRDSEEFLHFFHKQVLGLHPLEAKPVILLAYNTNDFPPIVHSKTSIFWNINHALVLIQGVQNFKG